MHMRASVQSRRGLDERHDRIVVGQDIGLVEGELVVEDIEELALDASDIALAKHTRAECPVDILECRIVAVLFRLKVSFLILEIDRNRENVPC